MVFVSMRLFLKKYSFAWNREQKVKYKRKCVCFYTVFYRILHLVDDVVAFPRTPTIRMINKCLGHWILLPEFVSASSTTCCIYWVAGCTLKCHFIGHCYCCFFIFIVTFFLFLSSLRDVYCLFAWETRSSMLYAIVNKYISWAAL